MNARDPANESKAFDVYRSAFQSLLFCYPFIHQSISCPFIFILKMIFKSCTTIKYMINQGLQDCDKNHCLLFPSIMYSRQVMFIFTEFTLTYMVFWWSHPITHQMKISLQCCNSAQVYWWSMNSYKTCLYHKKKHCKISLIYRIHGHVLKSFESEIITNDLWSFSLLFYWFIFCVR